ncbi:MAG: hypothetical protein M3394_01495 [Actinomycetota bacterium]|nr:hypothetical protein [Actinomycetota bacterium]
MVATQTLRTESVRCPPVPVMHYEVPEELHRRVKIAAAREGITLKEFMLRALTAAVETVEERRNA